MKYIRLFVDNDKNRTGEFDIDGGLGGCSLSHCDLDRVNCLLANKKVFSLEDRHSFQVSSAPSESEYS